MTSTSTERSAQKDVVAAQNDVAQAEAALEAARAGKVQAARRLELFGLQAGGRAPVSAGARAHHRQGRGDPTWRRVSTVRDTRRRS